MDFLSVLNGYVKQLDLLDPTWEDVWKSRATNDEFLSTIGDFFDVDNKHVLRSHLD
jgi:hypothetical protein